MTEIRLVRVSLCSHSKSWHFLIPQTANKYCHIQKSMKAFRSFSAFYTTQVINKKIAKYTQIIYLKKITCSMIPPGVYTSITLRLLNVRFLSLSLCYFLEILGRESKQYWIPTWNYISWIFLSFPIPITLKTLLLIFLSTSELFQQPRRCLELCVGWRYYHSGNSNRSVLISAKIPWLKHFRSWFAFESMGMNHESSTLFASYFLPFHFASACLFTQHDHLPTFLWHKWFCHKFTILILRINTIFWIMKIITTISGWSHSALCFKQMASNSDGG